MRASRGLFLWDAERPAEDACGIGEDAFFGTTEDDRDHMTAIVGSAADKAVLCLLGVPGFHSVAEPVVAHSLVRVAEQVDMTVRIAEREIFRHHDGTQDRIGISRTGNF